MMSGNTQKEELAAATRRRYSALAGPILQAYCEENDIGLHDDLPRLQAYIEQRLSNRYSPATIRQYRSAIAFALANNGIELEIGEIPPGENKGNGGRKKKRLPLDHSRLLLRTAFAAHFTDVARIAVTIMHCSRFFGLRPSEWFCAELDEAGQRLVVKNAKTTRGRSFGPTRGLHIGEDMPSDIIEAASWLLDTLAKKGYRNFSEPGEVPRELMQRLAAAASRVHDQAFPDWDAKKSPRYTMYSGRHQIAPDAKAPGYSKIEIAAMMGHGSPDTAGEHYGRRSAGGKERFHIQPDEADIQAVEKKVFTKRHEVPSFVL